MLCRGLDAFKPAALIVAVLLTATIGIDAVQQAVEVDFPAGIRALPTPTNPADFLKGVDIACVCTVESMTSEFLSIDPLWLLTKLSLRPVEIVHGNKAPVGPIEMWTLGGTYVKTPQGPKARGLSETVAGIGVGRQYFMAATIERRQSAWVGKYILNPVAMVDVTGDEVKPAPRGNRGWFEAVTAHGQSAAQTSDRSAFLSAVREGARVANPSTSR